MSAIEATEVKRLTEEKFHKLQLWNVQQARRLDWIREAMRTVKSRISDHSTVKPQVETPPARTEDTSCHARLLHRGERVTSTDNKPEWDVDSKSADDEDEDDDNDFDDTEEIDCDNLLEFQGESDAEASVPRKSTANHNPSCSNPRCSY